jgi:hypothetical protein
VVVRVQAKALEAQLAEATAVAERLQQANEELSARLSALEAASAAATVGAAPVAAEPVPLIAAPQLNLKTTASQPSPGVPQPGQSTPAPAAADRHDQTAAAAVVPAVGQPKSSPFQESISAGAGAAQAAPAGDQADEVAGEPTSQETGSLFAQTVSDAPAQHLPMQAAPAPDARAAALPQGVSAVLRHSLTGLAELPFPGLSQQLSQGSLEWVEGLLVGSQRESLCPAPAVPPAQDAAAAPLVPEQDACQLAAVEAAAEDQPALPVSGGEPAFLQWLAASQHCLHACCHDCVCCI